MLKELHTVLPAANLQRARTFYHDKLSLDPDQVVDGSLMYHLSPEMGFEIYETSNAGTAQNTQMGWMSDDLESEMSTLRASRLVSAPPDGSRQKRVISRTSRP